MINIAIAGQNGRVGQKLVHELREGHYPQLSFCGGTNRQCDPLPLFERADCVIDFTTPLASVHHAALAVETNTPLLIGTTGLSEEQEERLKEATKTVPILYAANTSIGVNLLMALVEQTAAKLDESWDLEILETHHRHKIDAPSGTALALSRAAEKGRGADSTLHTLHRQGRRESGSIGFAVRRGGDVAGEHCVSFYGPGERLELSHSASDRSLFARGALTAVPWLIQQKPGLYSMRDFLGF